MCKPPVARLRIVYHRNFEHASFYFGRRVQSFLFCKSYLLPQGIVDHQTFCQVFFNFTRFQFFRCVHGRFFHIFSSRINNQHLQDEKPSMITHTARIATRHLGGRKQLIKRPQAKVRPIAPLLQLKRFRIIIPPYPVYITVY